MLAGITREFKALAKKINTQNIIKSKQFASYFLSPRVSGILNFGWNISIKFLINIRNLIYTDFWKFLLLHS